MENEKKKIVLNLKYFDYSLLFFLIVLLGVGLVMLYSTSAYRATLSFGDGTYYLKRQLISSALGFFALFFCILVDYHLFEKLAWPIYLASVFLCVFVIFGGRESHGQSRWIDIGGKFSFQPSEIAKVALILVLAAIIQKYSGALKIEKSVMKMFIVVFVPTAAVAVNNLSTAIIIFAIGFIMLFIASRKSRLFFLVAGFGAAGLAITMLIPQLAYRFDRIKIWRDPEKYDEGYQTLQGLYAIGSGGLFGKGLGESIQKMGSVPEAQNDMIFSIICEELGLFGAICIIILYILLLWRCLFIAIHARDLFGSYVALGVMIHISLHVILNIAVVTNTLPNTGVTLPFISYGGSSIAILIAEVGLVLSVSKGIQPEV
ncbi:MAG: cell division protein FtsW [Lachnospiraceae bacterium]|nr:cell division protein FtsW [Lachnospiraceae bacterium]